MDEKGMTASEFFEAAMGHGAPEGPQESGGQAEPTVQESSDQPERGQVQAAEGASMDEGSQAANQSAREGTQPQEVPAGPSEAGPDVAKGQAQGEEGADEVAKKLRLLETYRAQLAHFQQLYERAKEEANRLKAQPQPGQSGQEATRPEQSRPRVTHEELFARHKAAIDAAVQQGVITEDSVEAVPDLVAGFYDFATTMAEEVAALRSALSSVIDAHAESVRQQAASAVIKKIAGEIERMAGEGEDFALLRDPNEVKGFFQHIVASNPLVSEINDKWLKAEWLRYKAEEYRAAMRQALASGSRPGLASAPVPPQAAKASKQGGGTWLDEVYDAFVTGGVRG